LQCEHLLLQLLLHLLLLFHELLHLLLHGRHHLLHAVAGLARSCLLLVAASALRVEGSLLHY
jgi:hypothetical protein